LFGKLFIKRDGFFDSSRMFKTSFKEILSSLVTPSIRFQAEAVPILTRKKVFGEFNKSGIGGFRLRINIIF
jgi:hypothetical protein